MSERLDVRRMLLKRGWDETSFNVLRKGPATWAGYGHNDSGLTIEGCGTIAFPRVPAPVIVAACEAAARVKPPAPALPGERADEEGQT